MRTTAIILGTLATSVLIPATLVAASSPPAPAARAATVHHSEISGTLSAAAAPTSTPAAAPAVRDATPVALSIPSIGLADPIQKMGVLANGQLAVPSGSTLNVGWYAAGTVPGQVGSAVLDAHVFAAFKNLHNVRVGESIYVTDQDGTVLRFVVQTVATFKLGDLSANYLYKRADARRLTLITCAGQLTPDHSTYTERLVVSAVLAS